MDGGDDGWPIYRPSALSPDAPVPVRSLRTDPLKMFAGPVDDAPAALSDQIYRRQMRLREAERPSRPTRYRRRG